MSSENKDKKENLDPLENLDNFSSENAENSQKSSSLLDELTNENSSENSNYSDPEKLLDSIVEESQNQKLQNVDNFEGILEFIVNNEIDYVLVEPAENDAKVTFSKNSKSAFSVTLKFRLYSEFLIQAKTKTGMIVSDSKNIQESEGETLILGEKYKIVGKVVPSNFGEKIFIKARKIAPKKEKTPVNKTQLLLFVVGLGVATLILGTIFITFVVLNAKTVEDVNFFRSLGVELNDINTFIARLVTVVFTFLTAVFSILLIISVLKFFLTPKQYKRKKLVYLILVGLVSIFTISIGGAWMYLAQKVNALPNWGRISQGALIIYDNELFVEKNVPEESKIIRDTNSLIGPLTLRFDVSNLVAEERRNGNTLKNISWEIGTSRENTTDPTLIKDFDYISQNPVKITLEMTDNLGKDLTTTVENIPPINIEYLVNIEKTKTSSGGILASFNATQVEKLGNISWYFAEDTKNKIGTGGLFNPSKIFFENSYLFLDVESTEKFPDRIFVIGAYGENELNARISYERTPGNDTEFTFKAEEINIASGAGFIKSFKWIIDSKEFIINADPENMEKSSEYKMNFSGFGEKKIILELEDMVGNIKRIEENIVVAKTLLITNPIEISSKDEELKVEFNNRNNEYLLYDVNIPTTLVFNAERILPDNQIYVLKDVEWNLDKNPGIDKRGKLVEVPILIEDNYEFDANLIFEHRISKEEIIVSQKIFAKGVKKDVIMNLDLQVPSEYVPVTVRFDASRTQIRGENVVKFVYDFGDNTPIFTGDAIVEGHLYDRAGTYNIKLTILTESGKEYSTTRTIVLKPKPQVAKISASMLRAPTNQGIDFSSHESDGEITAYFWDFGDGSVSTSANPTKVYEKSGKYLVNLRVTYSNRNIMTDQIEVDIYQN